jgi:hypothetical protein
VRFLWFSFVSLCLHIHNNHYKSATDDVNSSSYRKLISCSDQFWMLWLPLATNHLFVCFFVLIVMGSFNLNFNAHFYFLLFVSQLQKRVKPHIERNRHNSWCVGYEGLQKLLNSSACRLWETMMLSLHTQSALIRLINFISSEMMRMRWQWHRHRHRQSEVSPLGVENRE